MNFKLKLLLLITISLIPGFAFSQDIEYVGSTLWSGMNDMSISGNYAYCTFPRGLMTIDISDPANPLQVNFMHLSGYAMKIEIQENLAVVSVDNSILFIIDISDPANPQIINDSYTREFIDDICISGNFVYLIVNYPKQFQILDISNPSNPTLTFSTNLSSGAAVEVQGNYAYIANDLGLVVYNISDPAVPEFWGILNLHHLTDHIAVSGNQVLLLNPIKLYSVNISNPATPILESEYTLQLSIAYGIKASGNYAYVHGSRGLEIIDMSDPSNPATEGTYRSPDFINEICLQNSNALMVEEDYGLIVVNTSDPANPELAGHYYTYNEVSKISADDNYAYLLVTQRDSLGLIIKYFEIYNLSDISNPFEESRRQVNYYANNFIVSGQYAYIADQDSGLLVLDISNASNPTVIERIPYLATDLYLSGIYLYLANTPYMRIFDISSPGNPILIGNYECTINYGIAKVRISDNYAYILGCNGNEWSSFYNLMTVNIFDPQNPFLVDTLSIPVAVSDFVLYDHCIYVTSICQGFPEGIVDLLAYDFSNPELPVLVDSLYVPGYWSYVAVSDNYAFFAADILYIIENSNPANMNIIQTYTLFSATYDKDIEFHGNYLYGADEYSLQIFSLTPNSIDDQNESPENIALTTNYPNPFNAQTTIQYTLPSSMAVSIDILDILGRRIKTITPGMQPAGTHRAIWDGSNYSSGIYFYRINSGAFSETNHMTLLK
jgi:hypothetical protein